MRKDAQARVRILDTAEATIRQKGLGAASIEDGIVISKVSKHPEILAPQAMLSRSYPRRLFLPENGP